MLETTKTLNIENIMDIELKTYREPKYVPMGDNASEAMLDSIGRLGKCWVADGTLLGLFRDGDFIKDDTDIDIYVEGYDDCDTDIMKRMDGHEIIRTVYYDKLLQQIAFLKDDIIVDVYIHWEYGDKLINHAEQGYIEIDKNICRDIVMFDSKYGQVPVPRRTEDYLANRYGEDWRIPQSKKVIFETK